MCIENLRISNSRTEYTTLFLVLGLYITKVTYSVVWNFEAKLRCNKYLIMARKGFRDILALSLSCPLYPNTFIF